MNLPLRITICSALVASAMLAHWASWSHLSQPGPLAHVPLASPLEDFPMQLGDWQGRDRVVEEDANLYGDEYIQRDYVHADRKQMVALWLTYSKHGEDRGHHPEVCMVVAGKREDSSVRQTCPVGTEGNAVQQYRFAGPLGDRQWVFYWHYTMPPEDSNDLTQVQKLYQRLRRRPSSATVEVFAPEQRPDDAEFAREFVALVDEALQQHVGRTAVRGNRRLPVTVVEPSRVPQLE